MEAGTVFMPDLHHLSPYSFGVQIASLMANWAVVGQLQKGISLLPFDYTGCCFRAISLEENRTV